VEWLVRRTGGRRTTIAGASPISPPAWTSQRDSRLVQALALRDPLQHLASISGVEDDGLGEELAVVWELGPGARTLATATLPEPRAGRFDPPDQLAAFLDAVRWGAVTSADASALQAPFRSSISIEDYPSWIHWSGPWGCRDAAGR
jgi:hypothetical protein